MSIGKTLALYLNNLSSSVFVVEVNCWAFANIINEISLLKTCITVNHIQGTFPFVFAINSDKTKR